MKNRRTGKIARLPQAVRETVNLMLEDGATYNQIIEQLKKRGYDNINRKNLENWKMGGYQEWQTAKERRASILEQNTDLLTLTSKGHGITYCATALGMFQLFKVLHEFDPELLKQRLAENPDRYFDIILAYSRLLKTRQAIENQAEQAAANKETAKWFDEFEKEIRGNRISRKVNQDLDDEEEENDSGQQEKKTEPV